MIWKFKEKEVQIKKNYLRQIEKISSERNKLRNELIQIKEEKACGQEQLVQENTKLKTRIFLLEQKTGWGYGRWLPVKTGCEIKNPTRDPLIGQHDLVSKVRTTDLMVAVTHKSSITGV